MDQRAITLARGQDAPAFGGFFVSEAIPHGKPGVLRVRGIPFVRSEHRFHGVASATAVLLKGQAKHVACDVPREPIITLRETEEPGTREIVLDQVFQREIFAVSADGHMACPFFLLGEQLDTFSATIEIDLHGAYERDVGFQAAYSAHQALDVLRGANVAEEFRTQTQAISAQEGDIIPIDTGASSTTNSMLRLAHQLRSNRFSAVVYSLSPLDSVLAGMEIHRTVTWRQLDVKSGDMVTRTNRGIVGTITAVNA